jgi:hypothetical protein
MLDYPREFKKDKTFAIRTFFWWGNFFSITLQLSGEHKQQYLKYVLQAFKNGALEDWQVGIGEDPWEHHFGEDNYSPYLQHVDLHNKSFIKIATKIPLKEWDHVQDFLQKQFKLLLQLLTSNTVK